MKNLFPFLKKVVLFILSMICFHLGAKAQYLLQEHNYYTANAGNWELNSKQGYTYHSTGILQNKVKDISYSAWTNNALTKTIMQIPSYSATSPIEETGALTYNWNTSTNMYDLLSGRKTITTVASGTGTGTTTTTLIETYQNGQYQYNSKITETFDAANNKVAYKVERYGSNGYFTIIDHTWVFTNNLKTEGTFYFFDYNTGAFQLGVKSFWTYIGNNIDEEVEQRQTTLNGVFNNSIKNKYTYLTGNKIDRIESFQYNFNTSTWDKSGETNYVYNGNTEIRTVSGFQGTSQMSNIARRTTTTGLASNQVELVIDENWQNGAWVNALKFEYIYFLPTTSSRDINNNNIYFSVYPNPTTDFIQIKDFDITQNTRYQITDVQGRAIQQGVLLNSNDQIEIKNLEKGTYFFHLDNQTIKPIKFNKI